MTKIVKITLDDLRHFIFLGFRKPNTSAYYWDKMHEKINEGKITFSVKAGKKRKLVSGQMVVEDYESCQESSGTVTLIFIPNNKEKTIRLGV